MLMPKHFKFPKMHRGRMRGRAGRGAKLHYGDYGLQAMEPAWVSARQLEAARRAIVREARRRGKLWIRVFPDKPITKRAAETRMGKGKGSVEFYAAVIKPGRILFEVAGMPDEVAHKALKLGAAKLPIHTKIVERTEFLSE